MANNQSKNESAPTRESQNPSSSRDSTGSRDASATNTPRSASSKGPAERNPADRYGAEGRKSEADMGSDEGCGCDGKSAAAKSQPRTPSSQGRDDDQGKRSDE